MTPDHSSPSSLGKRPTFDTEHSTTFTNLPNKRPRTTSYIPPASTPRPKPSVLMPTNLKNLRPPKILGKRCAAEITDSHQLSSDAKRMRTAGVEANEAKTKIADLSKAEYEAALFRASEDAIELANESGDVTVEVMMARLVAFGVEYVKLQGLRPERVVKAMGAWQFGEGEEVVKKWLEGDDEEMS